LFQKFIKKAIKTYKELIVWQKLISFVTSLYKTLRLFPSHENFSLTSQIRRCSVSIPSNIAEGFGRNSMKDFIQFLRIAMVSLFDLQTQVETTYNLEYIKQTDFDKNYKYSRETEALSEGLIKSLTNKLTKD
tara:strand:- start:30639 stop:31034 length:396 start_codon:yes stop_codon:yes gene_type:complete